LQIWLHPGTKGLEPSYQEKKFEASGKRGRLQLIVSPQGDAGSLSIHQDARILAGLLEADEETRYELPADRHAWVQVVQGRLTVNGQAMAHGDGLAVSDEQELTFTGTDAAEFLVFDLG
jgi:quercetin 2,3-dioxygenase